MTDLKLHNKFRYCFQEFTGLYETKSLDPSAEYYQFYINMKFHDVLTIRFKVRNKLEGRVKNSWIDKENHSITWNGKFMVAHVPHNRSMI